MNKFQEAIIWLENTFNQYLGDWRLSSIHYGLYRDLKELVDKATPKKPNGYHTHYICPTCQKRVRSGKGSSSQIKDAVCRYCYQVLDWSNDE